MLIGIYLRNISPRKSLQYGNEGNLALLHPYKSWSKVVKSLSVIRHGFSIGVNKKVYSLLKSMDKTATFFHLNNKKARGQLLVLINGLFLTAM